MKKTKGTLIILSGFSGAGKGTVVRRLMELHDNYALSVSWTTRKPRVGEIDGVHYHFRTQEQFDALTAADGFLEHAGYVNHSYGTPLQFVLDQTEAGRDVILEIEVQGALQVKEKYPDAILVFVSTVDAETLEARLVGRGTETMDVIADRMARAVEEAKSIDHYDYLLINDDLDTCVEEFHNLVQSQHLRTTEHKDFIQTVQEDLKNRKENRL